MSTLVERLHDLAMDKDTVDLNAALLIYDAAVRIQELEAQRSRLIESLDAWETHYTAETGLPPGPLPTHPPLVTPVDPREDCSLTPWCVRT